MTVIFHVVGYGQDCGCDHLVPQGTTVINGDASSTIAGELILDVKAGDKICLQAGQYSDLNIKNIRGSASQPVIIQNCGGQVILGNQPWFHTIDIVNSEHFRLLGTGDASFEYGIKLDVDGFRKGGNAAPSGIHIHGESSDFEIANVEIAHTPFAGIVAKADPSCDIPNSWRRNFSMEHLSIHDCYIHDTGGEGMYIGYTGDPIACENDSIYPHFLRDVKIYDNKVERTGWDGIQVNRVIEECEIWNNTILDYGLEDEIFQNTGLYLGWESEGNIHHNIINRGSGIGVQIKGVGNVQVHNNLVANSGFDGIYANDYDAEEGRKGYEFVNNTIVSTGNFGLRMENHKSILGIDSTTDIFYNNLIVAPTSTQYGSDRDYLLISRNYVHNAAYLDSNNYYQSDLDGLFVEPSTDDYRLQEYALATDAGRDVSHLNMVTDLSNTSRVKGGRIDIGAYEHEMQTDLSIRGAMLRTEDCGKEQVGLNDNLFAEIIENATSYDFALRDTQTDSVQFYTARNRNFKLKNFSMATFAKSYAIKSRVTIGGMFVGDWSEECSLTSEGWQDTQLETAYCDVEHILFNEKVKAEGVIGATSYEFEIINTAIDYNIIYTAVSPYFYPDRLPEILYPGMVYQVRVRAFVKDQWTAWGNTCSITMATIGELAKLNDQSCDIDSVTYHQPLLFDPISGATAYFVEITSPTNQTEVVSRGVDSTFFSLSDFNLDFEANTEYSVRVKVVTSHHNTWGNIQCTIRTIPLPIGEIEGVEINEVINMDQIIRAIDNPNAIGWEFILENEALSISDTIFSENREFSLKDTPNTLYQTEYGVKVGVVTNFGKAYSEPYLINTESLPVIQMKAEVNGMDSVSEKTAIWSEFLYGADQYAFRLWNDSLGFDSTYVSQNNHTCLHHFGVLGESILEETRYHIQVKPVVEEVDGEFGEVATIRTAKLEVPPTYLKDQYCGIYGVTLDNMLWSEAVDGASSYTFRVRNDDIGYYQEYTNSYPFLKIKNLAEAVIPNKDYYIDVKARVQDLEGEYSKVCRIITYRPDGNTTLIDNDCGRDELVASDYLKANSVWAAGDYDFRIFNQELGIDTVYQSSVASAQLVRMGVEILPNTTYGIQVKANSPYYNGEFTDTCYISTASPNLNTFMKANQCTQSFSKENLIWAEPLPYADSYEFHIVNAENGYDYTHYSTSPFFKFKDLISAPVEGGKFYDIAVKASYQGEYGDFSESCAIGVQANNSRMNTYEYSDLEYAHEVDSNDELFLFPDPNDGHFHVSIHHHTEMAWILLEVLDQQGHVLVKKQYEHTSDVETDIDISNQSKGLYFIRVMADDHYSESRKVILR
ncbi:right-handed parallel beta-helix repeat-containing protein [Sediminitomix flava]|nr:right-handed parallel beta-helix repeat-containing protein [Sediminitomix flava]